MYLNTKDIDIKENLIEEINSGNDNDTLSSYENNPTIIPKSIDIKIDGDVCGVSLANNHLKNNNRYKFFNQELCIEWNDKIKESKNYFLFN